MESMGMGIQNVQDTGDIKTTMMRPTMLLMTMQMTKHCLYGTPARRTALHKFIDMYVTIDEERINRSYGASPSATLRHVNCAP